MGAVKEDLTKRFEYLAAKAAQKLHISEEEVYNYLFDEWAEHNMEIEAIEDLVNELIMEN